MSIENTQRARRRIQSKRPGGKPSQTPGAILPPAISFNLPDVVRYEINGQDLYGFTPDATAQSYRRMVYHVDEAGCKFIVDFLEPSEDLSRKMLRHLESFTFEGLAWYRGYVLSRNRNAEVYARCLDFLVAYNVLMDAPTLAALQTRLAELVEAAGGSAK